MPTRLGVAKYSHFHLTNPIGSISLLHEFALLIMFSLVVRRRLNSNCSLSKAFKSPTRSSLSGPKSPLLIPSLPKQILLPMSFPYQLPTSPALYHQSRDPKRDRERQARAYTRQMQEGSYPLNHHGRNKRYSVHLCPPCDPSSVAEDKLQIHYPLEFDSELPECILNSRWHFERRLSEGPASDSHRRRQPLKSILRRRSPPNSVYTTVTNRLGKLWNRVKSATTSSLAGGSGSLQTTAGNISPSGVSTPVIPSFPVVAGVKRKRGESCDEDPEDEDNVRGCPNPPREHGPQIYYGRELPYTAGSIEDTRQAKVSFAEAPEGALAELAVQRAAADIAGPHFPVPRRSAVKKAELRYSQHHTLMLRNDPEMAQLSLELADLVGKIVDCAETTFQQEVVSVMIEVAAQIAPRCPTYAGIRDDANSRLAASEEVKTRMDQLWNRHLTLQQTPRSQTGELRDQPSPPPMPINGEAQRLREEERRAVAASMPQSSAVWRLRESDPVAGSSSEASSLLWDANRPRRAPTPTHSDANTGDQGQSPKASSREVDYTDSHLPSTKDVAPKRRPAPSNSQRDTRSVLGGDGLIPQPASEGPQPPLPATRLPRKASKRANETDSTELPPRARPRTRSQTAPERGHPELPAPQPSPQTRAKPKGKNHRAVKTVSDAGSSHTTGSKSKRK